MCFLSENVKPSESYLRSVLNSDAQKDSDGQQHDWQHGKLGSDSEIYPVVCGELCVVMGKSLLVWGLRLLHVDKGMMDSYPDLEGDWAQ